MANKQHDLEKMLKWSNDILERIRNEGGDPEILIDSLAQNDLSSFDDACKQLLSSGVSYDTLNELMEFMEHAAELNAQSMSTLGKMQTCKGNDIKSKPGDVFVIPKSARLDASSKPELIVDSDVRCNIFNFDTKFVN